MATATTKTTHDVLVTAMAELIGVSVLAIIADSSETAGKILLALMVGWLLLYLMSSTGTSFFNSLTSKL